MAPQNTLAPQKKKLGKRERKRVGGGETAINCHHCRRRLVERWRVDVEEEVPR